MRPGSFPRRSLNSNAFCSSAAHRDQRWHWRDCDERAGQGFGLHGAPAGRAGTWAGWESFSNGRSPCLHLARLRLSEMSALRSL